MTVALFICTCMVESILILPFFSGDGLSSESSLNMNFILAALALQMEIQQCGEYYIKFQVPSFIYLSFITHLKNMT